MRLFLRVFLLFLLGTAAPLKAQLTRGFVSGSVTDSTDALIRNVQVILINKQTNISRETFTNDVGFYRFVAIDPGNYSMEFRTPGFETHKIDDFAVKTAQEVVINQTLAPASVAAEISVFETPGSELAKTTATVERTFTEREINELPMQVYNNVRDITRLALFAPLVARAPSFTEFSANGQRSRNNNFMLDGVDNNDLTVTNSSLRIIPEAVQQVQLQTVAYSAEFGRSSGAQFSAVTKAGTNLYHGEAWEYHRGNWMEPLGLANKRAGFKETPRYVVNQFGGDMGGPIWKDHTFFFGLLEMNRRREAASASNATAATIPTPDGYAALSAIPLGDGETPAAREAALNALKFLPDIHRLVTNYQNLQNRPINNVMVQTGTIGIPIARPAEFWYSVLVQRGTRRSPLGEQRQHQLPLPFGSKRSTEPPEQHPVRGALRGRSIYSAAESRDQLYADLYESVPRRSPGCVCSEPVEFSGKRPAEPNRHHQQLLHDWRIKRFSTRPD